MATIPHRWKPVALWASLFAGILAFRVSFTILKAMFVRMTGYYLLLEQAPIRLVHLTFTLLLIGLTGYYVLDEHEWWTPVASLATTLALIPLVAVLTIIFAPIFGVPVSSFLPVILFFTQQASFVVLVLGLYGIYRERRREEWAAPKWGYLILLPFVGTVVALIYTWERHKSIGIP